MKTYCFVYTDKGIKLSREIRAENSSLALEKFRKIFPDYETVKILKIFVEI